MAAPQPDAVLRLVADCKAPPPCAGFDLEADWLAALAPTSITTYRDALSRFARSVGRAMDDTPHWLFAAGRIEASRMARRYRADLLARGCAPATINMRLAALRSLVAAGRAVGLIEWTLDVSSVRRIPYRDPRGPSVAGVRSLLAATERSRGPRRRARDYAVLRVAFDLALRRAEIAGLRLADVELSHGTPSALLVLGKGHRERQRLDLAPATVAAVQAWIAVRGSTPGRLFGLSPRGVAKLIGRIAARTDLRHVTPHQLRHASITAALDATRGDVRQVRLHSRHANIATVIRYDDARRAGEVSQLVADRLEAL